MAASFGRPHPCSTDNSVRMAKGRLQPAIAPARARLSPAHFRVDTSAALAVRRSGKTLSGSTPEDWSLTHATASAAATASHDRTPATAAVGSHTHGGAWASRSRPPTSAAAAHPHVDAALAAKLVEEHGPALVLLTVPAVRATGVSAVRAGAPGLVGAASCARPGSTRTAGCAALPESSVDDHCPHGALALTLTTAPTCAPASSRAPADASSRAPADALPWTWSASAAAPLELPTDASPWTTSRPPTALSGAPSGA